MKKIFSSQKGFTLIEVLVAVTIFAIGLLAVAGMQVTSIKGNSTANTLTSGTAVAAGMLEQIVALPSSNPIFAADTVTPQPWTFAVFLPDGTSTTGTTLPIQGGGNYTAVYEIDIDYSNVNNLARIQVTVTGGATLDGSPRVVTLVGFKRLT